MIQLNLELEGFVVIFCNNGCQVFGFVDLFQQFVFVVLDVMFLEVSGLDICCVFCVKSDVLVFFFLVKGMMVDCIVGLKIGVNDYLLKLFDLEEFLLWVKVFIKMYQLEEVVLESIWLGDKEVNFSLFEVIMVEMGEKYDLSKWEIELLWFFVLWVDIVVFCDEILVELWGNDQFFIGCIIDNYILNFCKIFEKDLCNFQFFYLVCGVGYCFMLF